MEITHQLQEASLWIATGQTLRADDIPDVSEDPPESPVVHAFERAEFVAAGGPEDWDDTAPEGSDALAKRDARLDPVVANRMGLSTPFGSAALVKAARTETVNGWVYSYDGNNGLVSAHQTDTDGGRLEKRSGEEDSTVDLSKAASPGMVRFEHTTIDNEDWILGWNDRGENVRAYPAEDLA